MMKQVNIQFPLRMLALLFGLFLSVSAFAQIEVKGHVKDATGEPIIGATVRVDGTQTATVSDFDGNFVLKANQGANITVSYIGYQTATVKAAPTVEVTLQDDQTVLENVVVIGYGRAKKTDLTGSVTAVKPDEMNHGLQTNAQDMISGKIAGVSVISGDGTPGGGAQIRIRGGSSLNASNDPLIVIDGLAMDNYGVQGLANPLSMVNPNDIESFTVLKDASATAIYGSRASNGVIIITTKKGRSNQKPSFNYSGNVSISTKKKTIDVMDGPAYTNFIRDLYGEESSAFKSLGYLDANGEKQYANTDWQNEIFRTAVSTDHNLTMSGGLKNMPYRVSLGYTNSQGILKTSSFERFTGSISLSPSLLKDHLKLNINGKGMIAKNRYADGGAVGAAVWMDPTKPVSSDNAIYKEYFGGYVQWYSKAKYDGADNWLYTKNSNATSNPVALLDQKDDRATSKSLIGNIEADYSVHGFEDLHLHMNAAMDISTGKQNNDVSRYSATNNYYGWTGWNTMDTYNLQLSLYAQYMKDFAKIHHFDVMAGYEWQHFHKKTDWYGYGSIPMDNTTNPGGKQDAPADEDVTEYKTENYLVSFFGRFNYTLLDRYMLTFTLRADGSSRFNWMEGNPNQQWGYFPALALAWRMKEESFLKNIDFMNDAKLRLGWGVTGQQEGIGDYTYIPVYLPNTNTHALYSVLGDGKTYRPEAYNPKLTWEKTTTWNAGIDLAFLNNRIEFSFDWYYRKTKDLINLVYVPAGSNFRNKVTSNVGSLHNTGLEIMTTVRPIQTKDLRWEVSYNFTYNKNEIDELISGQGADYFVETGGGGTGTGGTVQAHTVGHSSSAFHVYQQVYDQDGKAIPNTFVDRNGNGYLDSGDKYYYYKPAADVLMGLSSKLQYKQWDLGFSMRASLGNYVYNNVAAGGMNVGSGSVYTLGFLGNRQNEAVNRGFTNPTEQQYYSDYFVENASFLKMDNITLGYSFEKLFGAPIGGRVYATVQNVFTITKYSGIDPEVASGIGGDMYPRPFTTIIGASLNF
jgi:iron complex outermembrane receptor protein